MAHMYRVLGLGLTGLVVFKYSLYGLRGRLKSPLRLRV